MFGWFRRPAAATQRDPEAFFSDRSSGDSGVVVNKTTALSYAYVWQAVTTLAGDIASLPLEVYERQSDDGRERDTMHPAWWRLNEDANEFMTANTLREVLTAHALLYGNGYAAIDRSGNDRRLIPLLPEETQPVVSRGQLVYETNKGKPNQETIRAEDILHIKGLGWNGIEGYSVLTMARNSFGLGLTMERHGNRHFKNNARPGVVLKHPRTLDKKSADELLSSWESRHSGNPDRPALAAGGLDIEQLTGNNDDAQWLAGREFQRDEVASWFKMPPHKLGSSARVSYNSLENEERSYLQNTLRYWLCKWEKEAGCKLLTDLQRRNRTHYIEHNVGELIRGDMTTQMNTLRTGIESTILSPNEARKKLNMPPRDGGDTFENPNTSSSTAATIPVSEPAPVAMASMIDWGAERQAMGDTVASAVAAEFAKVEPDLDSTALDAAHRALLHDRVRGLFRTEASKVRKSAAAAAAGRHNFLAWLDEFYAEWPAKVANDLRPILAAIEARTGEVIHVELTAVALAYSSHAALLDLSGMPSDEFAAAVSKSVDQWEHERADEFTASLLGE